MRLRKVPKGASTDQMDHEADMGHHAQIHKAVIHQCSTPKNTLHCQSLVHTHAKQPPRAKSHRFSQGNKTVNNSTACCCHGDHGRLADITNRHAQCMHFPSPISTEHQQTLPQGTHKNGHVTRRSPITQYNKAQKHSRGKIPLNSYISST